MAVKTNPIEQNQKEIDWIKALQNWLMTWVDIDDEFIKKPQSLWDWWDKAFANSNPELKEKNRLYQEYNNQLAWLQTRLSNLSSAEQYMTDIVSENKDRINKIYNLQNKAAALSAWIQWTNRVAWWLWAASNVLNNSLWVNDATLRQAVAQNEAARQTALLNNAQQALNIPSTIASINASNASADAQRSQANYYNSLNNQTSTNTRNSYTRNSNANVDARAERLLNDMWLNENDSNNNSDNKESEWWMQLVATITETFRQVTPWKREIWNNTYYYEKPINWVQHVYKL